MSNPASTLHEIFSGWRASYNSHVSALDARGLKTDEGADRHVEVFRLLIAIRNSLDYLEQARVSVPVYREEYPRWIRMALNAPNSWASQSNPEQGLPSESMAHLSTLATLLDASGPQLDATRADELRATLNEVTVLLGEDASISNALRTYIFRLVNEMRIALDDEAIMGSFDFAEAAERLWVGMQAAAGTSKSHRARWKASANGFFRDLSVAVLGSAPTLALTAAQIASMSS